MKKSSKKLFLASLFSLTFFKKKLFSTQKFWIPFLSDDVKTSEVCVQVKTSGKKALIGEFNDLKKYITTIEDKASRIISEYQEKNKSLAYELKESNDIQKRHKQCEDILQDANDGLMAKNAKQNEQIKSMKNEMGK